MNTFWWIVIAIWHTINAGYAGAALNDWILDDHWDDENKLVSSLKIPCIVAFVYLVSMPVHIYFAIKDGIDWLVGALELRSLWKLFFTKHFDNLDEEGIKRMEKFKNIYSDYDTFKDRTSRKYPKWVFDWKLYVIGLILKKNQKANDFHLERKG